MHGEIRQQKMCCKINNKTILVGLKDPTTDLWNLLIVGPAGKTTHVEHEGKQDPFVTLYEEHLEPTNESNLSNTTMLTVPVCASAHACGSGGKATASLKKNPPSNQVSFFTHTVRTKANSIKFAHQSLCSPRISTLLKAIRRGFLKGFPNLTAKCVSRYLNPSPAMAKGHMKRPHQGICSTTPRQPRLPMPTQPLPISHDNKSDNIYAPHVNDDTIGHSPNYIADEEDSTYSNIFCFGAFADKDQE
jgi:hypothetical protein